MRRIVFAALVVAMLACFTGCPHHPYEKKTDILGNMAWNMRHAWDDFERFALIDRPSMLYPEFVDE